MLTPNLVSAKPPDFYCDYWIDENTAMVWIVYEELDEACGYLYDYEDGSVVATGCGAYGGCPGVISQN